MADLIREAARRLDTPVVFALPMPGEDDMTAAAENAVRRARPGGAASGRAGRRGGPGRRRPGRALRGLFAGGTLRDEAEMIARGALGWDLETRGHRFTDFGDDAYTRGRAHPMIDPTLRLEALRAEAADPRRGVLLLDVVLGHGAEPTRRRRSPRPSPRRSKERPDLAVVVSLCGTAADPQNRDRQAEALCEAGADVFASNAEADPARAVDGGREFRMNDQRHLLGGLLTREPGVVAAGVEVLAEALAEQAVPVEKVDWRPPPAGTGQALAAVLGATRPRGRQRPRGAADADGPAAPGGRAPGARRSSAWTPGRSCTRARRWTWAARPGRCAGR